MRKSTAVACLFTCVAFLMTSATAWSQTSDSNCPGADSPEHCHPTGGSSDGGGTNTHGDDTRETPQLSPEEIAQRNADVLHQQALKEYGEGRYQAALEDFEQAKRIWPDTFNIDLDIMNARDAIETQAGGRQIRNSIGRAAAAVGGAPAIDIGGIAPMPGRGAGQGTSQNGQQGIQLNKGATTAEAGNIAPIVNRGAAPAKSALQQLKNGTNGKQSLDQTFDNGLGASPDSPNPKPREIGTPTPGTTAALQEILDRSPAYRAAASAKAQADIALIAEQNKFNDLNQRRAAATGRDEINKLQIDIANETAKLSTAKGADEIAGNSLAQVKRRVAGGAIDVNGRPLSSPTRP